MLLLSAHDRDALLWSSLPLPWDSSVCWPDKPWIFWLHSVPMSFGVWTIFIFIWLILILFLSLLCHPTHSYLLSPHLIFHNSELAYSFHFYLPLCLLLGYGLCARPALNMYVYKHLVSAIGIPQTWNQLGSHYHLSPLQQPWGCSCWLLNHALDLSPTVCSRHLGENRHSSDCLSLPISLLECLWHFRRKLVSAEES